MTSMLLTERIAPASADDVFSICAATAMQAPKELSPRHGAGREIFELRRLVARLRALRPRLVLGHVVRRRRFEQWAHLVLHGRNPVGDLHPLGAVPLLYVCLLYTSDAADDLLCVDLGVRRIIQK